MALIPGIPFPGKDWIIPPLALGDLETLQERIGGLQVGAIDPASIGTIIDATHAALKRNYPELLRADVAGAIDLGNMVEVIQSVMDVAGVKRQEFEAEKKAAADPKPD
jgi:hypothetical protein